MLEVFEYCCDSGNIKLGTRQPAIIPFLVCRFLCRHGDFEGNYSKKKFRINLKEITTKNNSF